MTNYKKKAIWFLISQGITLFGSSVVSFAIIWFVALETTSGVWVSALTVAAYLPQFLISFISGAWADRYSRKWLIIVSDASIAVATLGLALCLPFIPKGNMCLLALIAISVIRSLATGIQTPAVNAAIPLIVPEDKLMKYNGVNTIVQSVVQFMTPAVAGVILTYGTLRWTLLIDVITAIFGIGILVFISIPFVKGEEAPSMKSEMLAGFAYAKNERFIAKLLISFGIFIFLCVPAGFMATLFVSRYYGRTYWYMTLVEVVGFIGMAGGGLLISAWGGFKNRVATLVVGMAAFGVLGIGMGVINNYVVYLILMVIYGVALTMVQTASTTLLQENVDPKMQGRMFGLFGAIYSGFLPLGMILFGPLADVMSLRFLMVGTGVLLVLLAMALFLDRKFYRFKKIQPGIAEETEETEG